MARLENGGRSACPKALVRVACQVLPRDLVATLLRNDIFTAKTMRQWHWLLIILILGCVPAFARTDVNDIHVPTRQVDAPKEAPKQDLLASTTEMKTH